MSAWIEGPSFLQFIFQNLGHIDRYYLLTQYKLVYMHMDFIYIILFIHPEKTAWTWQKFPFGLLDSEHPWPMAMFRCALLLSFLIYHVSECFIIVTLLPSHILGYTCLVEFLTILNVTILIDTLVFFAWLLDSSTGWKL